MAYKLKYSGQEIDNYLGEISGKYSKPSDGIPYSDLSPNVRSSIDKAKTALQEQRADENYIKKNVWDDITVATTDGFFSDIAGLHFALPYTANGEEDDVILSRETVKTINGQSILGSGDIAISGGGGENIRYFTDFTVEDFIEGVKSYSSITEDIDTLIEAVRSNKIICIPFRQMDKGYKIAYYKFYDTSNDTNIYIEHEGAMYEAFVGGGGEYLEGSAYTNYTTKYVLVDNDAETFLEVLSNTVYCLKNDLESLFIYGTPHTPSTIIFRTGNNFSIESYGLRWANGVIPQIEIQTVYELSICDSIYGLNAVLTPFKPVE